MPRDNKKIASTKFVVANITALLFNLTLDFKNLSKSQFSLPDKKLFVLFSSKINFFIKSLAVLLKV